MTREKLLTLRQQLETAVADMEQKIQRNWGAMAIIDMLLAEEEVVVTASEEITDDE